MGGVGRIIQNLWETEFLIFPLQSTVLSGHCSHHASFYTGPLPMLSPAAKNALPPSIHLVNPSHPSDISLCVNSYRETFPDPNSLPILHI